MKEKINISGFSELTKENILHYVYCLVDPRDNKIFYVGMGQGNRMFDHARAALSDAKECDKLNLIREIIAKDGKDVRYYIIRHGLTENQAAEIESILIDLLTSPLLKHMTKMTVEMKGWYASVRGMRSISELEAQYSAKPFELQKGDYPVFLNIHKSYSSDDGFDIYSAVRSAWAISQANINRITHVFAVYHNVIRAVYRPIKWNKTADGKLWEFDGVEENNSPYLNNSVKDIIAFNPKGIGYFKMTDCIQKKEKTSNT